MEFDDMGQEFLKGKKMFENGKVRWELMTHNLVVDVKLLKNLLYRALDIYKQVCQCEY